MLIESGDERADITVIFGCPITPAESQTAQRYLTRAAPSGHLGPVHHGQPVRSILRVLLLLVFAVVLACP